MNFLSGRGAEEPTVYGWNTKVSAPFALSNQYYAPKYLIRIYAIIGYYSSTMRPESDKNSHKH